MMRSTALAFAALALTPVSAAYAQTTKQPVPTANEQSAVDRAAERGRMIYAYDQAAWHSTDRMMEQLDKNVLSKIMGWVVVPDGNYLKVVYYGAPSADGRRPAIFIAIMDGQKLISSTIPDSATPVWLDEREMAMAKAFEVAIRQPLPSCGERPNTVVFTPDANGAVDVYILTPQTKAGFYPAGGHSLITVSPDGKIKSKRDFTKSCLEIGGDAPKRTTPAALMATHLLDPTPTEIHVWLSLWSGLPIYILTTQTKKMWEVNGDKITLTANKF